MLTELRVGDCKADVVILNGTSTVYEIKSELDSLERVHSQIEAYSKMFDRIIIVSSVAQSKKLRSLLPDHVGLQILRSDNKVEDITKAKSNKHNVVNSVIFDTFRKQEYIRIIKSLFDTVPDVPNTQIFEKCKNLFCGISPERAHRAMIETLSRRSNGVVLRNSLETLPYSLSAWAVSINIDEDKHKRLSTLLEQSVQEVLS
jgi:hypothetical protein